MTSTARTRQETAARDILVLGATGSIGTQALDVVGRSPERFRVVGLAARGGRLNLLAEQILTFAPEAVAVELADAGSRLPAALAETARSRGLSPGGYRIPEILIGAAAVAELAGRSCDVVLNGLTGSVGLASTLAALDAGSTLALANKESLVVGGPLVRARSRPGQIVPVDSEHSALAQCLRGGARAEVRRLVLTASGGPFRGRSRAELADVTVEEALAHPTWNMGPVVTINSATLVNKGLEVIEAHLLFDLPFEAIEVMVHPQSVIHSMVEFADGSTLAQASPPDMRLPIALGLAWPDRVADAAPGLDWSAAHTWELFPLDDKAFPAVALAREAGAKGGTFPAVYNAANEECVAAFREGRLPFLGIVDTVARLVGEHAERGAEPTLEEILAADGWARRRVAEITGTHR